MHLLKFFSLVALVQPLALAGALDPIPDCETVKKTPPPKGLICEAQGRVKKGVPISTSGQPNLAVCRDNCLANNACISYSYASGNKSCIQYSSNILGSGFKKGNTGVTFANRRCYKNSCTCPSSVETLCGNRCAYLPSDPFNCGSCGHECGGSQFCSEGECTCGSSRLLCEGECVQSNNDNCGSCGNACDPELDCVAGTCQCLSGPCQCAPQEDFCDGACTNTLLDNNNCGDCGNVCDPGYSCLGGVCECTSGACLCNPLQDFCNGQCVDIFSNDKNNCGGCGVTCNNGDDCLGGVCECLFGACQCSADETFCFDAFCSNLQSDSVNCGSCGNICALDKVCTNGQCKCPAGQLECEGVCVDDDLTNCGICGNACDVFAGQICDAGTCKCPPGQTLCNGLCTVGDICAPSGPTCGDTQFDSNNCGSCGNVCPRLGLLPFGFCLFGQCIGV